MSLKHNSNHFIFITLSISKDPEHRVIRGLHCNFIFRVEVLSEAKFSHTPIHTHNCALQLMCWHSQNDKMSQHEILILITLSSSQDPGELSMHIGAVSPEPSMLACTKYGSRGRLRPNFRPLDPQQKTSETDREGSLSIFSLC